MNKENKKSHKILRLIGLFILILFLGFGAGILGELFTRYYLSNWSYFSDLYFTENNTALGQKQIVINDPRRVYVEEDLMLNQTVNSIEPMIVGIYQKKPGSKNIVDDLMLPGNFLGQASVLTSDGWLLSTQNTKVTPGADVVITSNKKIYEIDKVVSDSQTGIVFIKISVQNLPVIKLADYNSLTLGEHLALYNSFTNQVSGTSLQNLEYKDINSKYDYVFSSQSLDKRILLKDYFGANFKGSAVFDYQNEAVGILVSDNNVVPINYIQPVISYVLKGEKISRPYLGINYINLAQVNGLTDAQTQGQQVGALIWSDAANKSVASDSPLLGKLTKGDIITSLEGQNIDATNDLASLLLEYKSGQSVDLKYYHNGVEGDLSIKLK